MLLRVLGSLLLWGPAFVAAIPLSQAFSEDEQDPTFFSLEVPSRTPEKRDFVREWTSTRRRWGGDVPEGVHSMFNLGDSGKKLT